MTDSTVDLQTIERQKLEEHLAGKLPADLRKRWYSERGSKMAVESCSSSNIQGVSIKDPKPVGDWAIPTANMRLGAVLMIIDGGRQVHPERNATFRAVIQPDYVNLIIPGPWARYARSSKVEWLQSCRIMAQRLLGKDAPWLGKAVNRLNRDDPSIPDPDRQRTRDEYIDAARQMSPLNKTGLTYTVQDALMSRHAATNALFAALGCRRSELCALCLQHVYEIDGQRFVQIPGSAGKTRIPQVRKISPPIAEILMDYIEHGRPILLGPGKELSADSLWISVDGRPLSHYGVMASLAEPLRAVLGVTANANIMRRATANRPDIVQANIRNYLGQRGPEGEERYQSRSRPEAVQANLDFLRKKFGMCG